MTPRADREDKAETHAEAKARIAAARLCSGSQYLGGSAIILFVLGWFGLPFAVFVGLVAALAAFPLAAFGLVWLRHLGPGRLLTSEVRGLERVGLRMGRRAKRQAMHGLLWSGLPLGLVGLIALSAWLAHGRSQARHAGEDPLRPEEVARMAEHLEKQWRAEQMARREAADASARWEGGASAGMPTDLAAMNALHELGKHMAYPGYTPEEPLPEATLARRLEAVLDEYPRTRTARLVREGSDQPYREMKRILEAHGWTPSAPADD